MDEDNKPGYKTTELWLTTIVALVDIVLATTAPNSTTITLIICLSVTAVVYLTSRTVFKVARLKYRPDLVTSWKAPDPVDPAYLNDPSPPIKGI